MNMGRSGYRLGMTSHDAAHLDEVMVPTEQLHPDHRQHAKEAKYPSEDDLERRTHHERDTVEAEQPPAHD